MIVRKYCGLCLLMILTLITCSPKEVGPYSSPQDYNCKPPPPDVFTAVGVDLEFTQSTFGKIITGDFNIETDPQVIALATKAVTDDRIRNYLRCLAIHRDKYTNDQAAYFDLKSNFMATEPTTEQLLEWQKDNPYPMDRINNITKIGDVADFVFKFSADDWQPVEGDGHQLRIPFEKHKVNYPHITVQQKEENGNWKDIDYEREVDKFNNVIVTIATVGFDGRVVLK